MEWYREELRRRAIDRQTGTLVTLTKVLTVLTAVNVVLVGVTVLASRDLDRDRSGNEQNDPRSGASARAFSRETRGVLAANEELDPRRWPQQRLSLFRAATWDTVGRTSIASKGVRMHAIVTRSTVHDFEQGRSFLQNEAIPRVRQTPGFVAAYWVRLEGDQGTAMVVFESEDAARQMAEQFRPPEGVVTIDSLEVGEVVERA